jgi:hypothetical protein
LSLEAVMETTRIARVLLSMLSGIALLGLSACATTEELDAVRNQFSSSSMGMKRQIESLQKQVQAQEQKAGQQERYIQDMRQSVAAALDRQRAWGQELNYLRATVQEKDNALQSLLAAQETVYRDALRSVQTIRGRTGGQGIFTDTRPPGAYGMDYGAGPPVSQSMRSPDPRYGTTDPRYGAPDPAYGAPETGYTGGERPRAPIDPRYGPGDTRLEIPSRDHFFGGR